MSVKKGPVPRSWCKACASEASVAAQTAKRAIDPEGVARAARLNKRNQVLKRYGITPEQVNEMGEAQDWKCAICTTDILEAPHIDHDHATGKVRQLLCLHCNIGLGHFQDKPDILEKAIAYLKKHR